MRYDLVEKVKNDLKGIIPYKEDIIWEDFKSIRRLGVYKIKENKILINEYLDSDEEIMSVMAHELIHAAGVNSHRLEFKEYMNTINSLNLGYIVHTCYKTTEENKNNTYHQKQKEQREKREQKSKLKPKKEYIVWCEHCGYNYISNRKCHKLSKYVCPKCYGKLRQKQYKKGKTTIRITLN